MFKLKLSLIIGFTIYLIFISPVFFEYYNFLPSSTKILNEIFLIVCFVLLLRKGLKKNEGIAKFLEIYFFGFFFINFISGFINGVSFPTIFVISRKYIYYVILIYIINYLLRVNKVNKVFSNIFHLQILFVPIQFLSGFLFLGFVGSILVEDISILDLGAGTIGRGTGLFSVCLLLFFIFQLFHLKNNFSFLYLIPIFFTFSGAVDLLLIVVLVRWLFFKSKSVKRALLRIAKTLALIILIVLISNNLLGFNLFTESYDYIFNTQVNFEENIVSIDGLAPNGQMSRYHGYKYIINNIDDIDAFFWGHGPGSFTDIKSAGVNLMKNSEVTEIMADSQLKFAELGLIGVFWLIIPLLILLIKGIKKQDKFYDANNSFFIFIFILSLLYIAGTNSIHIISIFILTLLYPKKYVKQTC